MSTHESISAEDRAALAESIRDVLRRRSDSASVRAAIRTQGRMDRAVWETLCTEVGVAALAVPEQYDGAGAALTETALAVEEVGAALAPVPVFSSAVLAAGAVLASGDDDAAARLVPGLASGERIGALCWADAAGWSTPGVVAEAGLLSGTAEYVIDGESADVFLVVAGRPGEAGAAQTLHEVDANAEGVTVTPLPLLDPTRPLARVSFDEVSSTTLASPPDVAERIRTLAWAMLSAEQVGGAARALELTVEHTTSRKQFGRALASFQALKHAMADMYVKVEAMRSMSAAAIDALVQGRDDAAELAAAAHVYCSEGYMSVTGSAVQLHGGIGITWEHDIGMFFKRAQADAQLFGQPHHALARVSLSEPPQAG
ncbi:MULTISPECIES: acyl-CoA dehydrogenase family protein [Gordonia]|uniref:Putative acyl-CoA dehydrogenase n=1 Tax=Gordonia sihwensis NBRC 108236 TaxID=1223544 RepID=L7LK29_9ACTN|nr:MULTISPECIES: acyl-CoA dehydrogenase family protein [Gordonia]AUH68056.1 acyl-CoA dehydrogenase [Gordonia sp. YC-JH1]MBY4569299.1 acyl-CoA dehydrogenase [Gordonia sihwensis]GAC60408.1 putative acyl-CoA dehydrogenase [Gordonia sihwensis NBRC 108236]